MTLTASVLMIAALGCSPPTTFLAPEGDVAAASNAFKQGQRAELSGEHARAAEFFELAHEIVPSAAALRSAVKNREKSGQQERAASLALILQETYEDKASQALASEVLSGAEASLVRLDVNCDAPCSVGADGKALVTDKATTHTVFITPGSHDVTASFAEGLQTLPMEGEKGSSVSLSFTAPTPTPTPVLDPPEPDASSADAEEPTPPANLETEEPKKSRRISPAFFVTGTVVTLGLAGATVWSGLDVLDKNKAYEETPTEEGYSEGVRLETRTNILIGATAAVGVATVVFAIVTDWERWKRNDSRRASATVFPMVSGARGVALTGRF